MNSRDPWDPIIVDPAGDVIFPRPYYGHPFYREVPSWVTPRSGETRLLFDGAFIGADPGGFDMATPAIATNGPGGLSVLKELDDKQVLHVKICVDGKCYQTSMDLAPAFALLMGKLARWHQDMHKPAGAPVVSGEVVMLDAMDRAVGAAGDELVGTLLGRHYSVAGWWDSLTHGIKAVVDKAGDTIKYLKVPISLAAGATAGALVGPAAAPLAAQMTGALADAAGGDYQSAGQAALKVAEQAAAQNPQVAQILNTAKASFTQAAAAHHVAATAQQAAAGAPKAQQQVAQIAQAAAQGDPKAQQLIKAAQSIAAGHFDLSSLMGMFSGAAAPAVSGWYDIAGWYDIVGAGSPSPLEAARARGKEIATAKRGGAAGGAIHSLLDGRWHAYSFSGLDDAIDWLQRVTRDRSSFTYAAAYEKDGDGNAYIQGEEFGGEGRMAA